jgi:ABC-type Fe3+-hydroxamate transport system substrate-binding protein
MKVVRDQMNREVRLSANPYRIISLVPSQTELLFDLGLTDAVIGITKFCIHPESWFKNKTRIGGTKNLDLDKIRTLQPDLILGNKEENEQSQIEALESEFPVWMSDIHNLDGALEMILQVGLLCHKETQALALTHSIREQFSGLIPLPRPAQTLYLIWQNPYMTAGVNTFINDMLGQCGFLNVISQPRYPELTPSEIRELNPELILLSSEPYPFKEKHIAEFRKLCPQANIMLVDGEYFSWYGSRLLKASAYFRELLARLSESRT